MELRHIRYFIAAAEESNFGRAAERLNISPPAVAQQIKELERELGFELFQRLARGVQLTAAGNSFLAHARPLLEDLQHAIERAGQVAQGQTGHLRIGHLAMSMLGRTGIVDLIPAFCRQYPNVDVQTFELSMSQQITAVKEGQIDVGIFYVLPDADYGLTSEILHERLLQGVLMPATHSLARKHPLHCEDLRALPYLSAHENSDLDVLLMREFLARGLEPRVVESHIKDFSIRLGFIAAGEGWLPVNVEGAMALTATNPGIVFREWAEPPIHLLCSVSWRRGDGSALLTNFLSVVREFRDKSLQGKPEGLPRQ